MWTDEDKAIKAKEIYKNKYPDLSIGELNLISNMSRDQDYWFGYSLLSEMCECCIEEIKMHIKSLKSKKIIHSLPIFSESTGLLCGRGWFLKDI